MGKKDVNQSTNAGDVAPRRYVFLLIPGFSMLGFTCALETLTLANRHSSGRRFYEWTLISADGAPAAAWNGVTVSVDAGLIALDRDDILVVCAGEDVALGSTKEVLAWLRRETRKGIMFGALSSGAYTLGLAGLLTGKRITTHWEYSTALKETLPQVSFEDSIFTVDGRVFTCAGGASSMDLMLHMVDADYGPMIANWVSDQMVYTPARDRRSAQRQLATKQPRAQDAKLARAVALMRANTEDPLSTGELAQASGVSKRQLERLFALHLDSSPTRFYQSLRLEKARDLLHQTELPISQISVLCGFVSASHFSRLYKAAFGVAPSQDTRGPKTLAQRQLGRTS